MDMPLDMDEDPGVAVEETLTELGANSEQKFIGGVMNKVRCFPQA